ncbi:MAG: SDR family NAD(P)-dependent oxidoreductase [Elusimicrobiota bacterium]|nr:MAG: SDR family NAD(P)-dependent oxidoreductase [Elusimicrobiota bacterium]
MTRALVTGATSGLGREAAVQLARRGWKVAVSGRREEQLRETARLVKEAGGEPLVLLGSVTDPAVVKAHYAELEKAWGGVDYALLNAGVGDMMDAAVEFSTESIMWTFDANVFGVCRWIEAVLPGMLSRKMGVIAGVASLAGFRGLPKSGPYSASKAALITLLESTRIDLRGTGVDVVTVCPGFVRSEMTARNEVESMPFLMETADGVAAMLRGIDARERVVHFPWQLSYTTKYVLPAIPDFLYEPLAQKFAHKRKKKPSMPK